jgi:hypothetical protein
VLASYRGDYGVGVRNIYEKAKKQVKVTVGE